MSPIHSYLATHFITWLAELEAPAVESRCLSKFSLLPSHMRSLRKPFPHAVPAPAQIDTIASIRVLHRLHPFDAY